MILKKKLRTTEMQKSESITSYLTRIQGVWDELVVVREKPIDSEQVQTTLKEFTKEWLTFVQRITRQDKLPDCECLWSDFTQQEIRLNLVDGASSGGEGRRKRSPCKKGKGEEGSQLGTRLKGREEGHIEGQVLQMWWVWPLYHPMSKEEDGQEGAVDSNFDRDWWVELQIGGIRIDSNNTSRWRRSMILQYAKSEGFVGGATRRSRS